MGIQSSKAEIVNQRRTAEFYNLSSAFLFIERFLPSTRNKKTEIRPACNRAFAAPNFVLNIRCNESLVLASNDTATHVDGGLAAATAAAAAHGGGELLVAPRLELVPVGAGAWSSRGNIIQQVETIKEDKLKSCAVLCPLINESLKVPL